MSIAQFGNDLLVVFGVCAAVAAGIKGIAYILGPYRQIKEQLDEHAATLAEHSEYLSLDKDAIQEIQELTKDSLKIQLSILNHMIDGNGVDAMKTLRNELQDKL